MDDLLKQLGPEVLGVLARRGADFAAAEDAVQEALIEAVRHWSDQLPEEPKAWLVTVAGRKLVDAQRAGPAAHPTRGPADRAAGALPDLQRGLHR